MTDKSELRKYYSKCKLELKPNPQWRLFKIQLVTGAWLTIPNQIRNEEMLRKYLVKYAPLNVFSTVCTFLNPLALENNNFKIASHILLTDDSFIFIDIDAHDIKLAERIKEFMIDEKRYELWREVDSGNGIHLYYYDNESVRYRDPLRRMDYQLKLREDLVNKFKKAGINFDYGCLSDLTRVSREIGTLNDGNLDKVCHVIHDYTGLQRRKPMKAGREEKQLPTFSRHNIRKEGPSRPRPLSNPMLMKFTDAIVYGTKNMYIPYVCFTKYTGYEKKLQEVVDFYNLGKFYVFESGRDIFGWGLKVLDKNKYKKVLRATNSRNLGALEKYGHVWIRVSSTIDKNLNVVHPKPKYISTIGETFPKGQYSRPHYNLLKQLGVDIPDNIELIGNDKNPIRVAYDKSMVKINGE